MHVVVSSFQNKMRYFFILEVKIANGIKTITARSPLRVCPFFNIGELASVHIVMNHTVVGLEQHLLRWKRHQFTET